VIYFLKFLNSATDFQWIFLMLGPEIIHLNQNIKMFSYFSEIQTMSTDTITAQLLMIMMQEMTLIMMMT